MAYNPTIIGASLDDSALENAIKKLVSDVNDGMLKAADNFDAGVQLMEGSLKTFSTSAKTTAKEIKDTFTQLGMTFDNFAKAMEKAANAASGMGGGKGSSGGSSSVAAPGSVGELRQQIAEAERLLNTYKQWSVQLQQQVDLIAKQKANLKAMLTDTETLTRKNTLGDFRRVNAMPTRDLAQAEAKLRELQKIANTPATRGVLSPAEWQRLWTAIDRTQAKVDKLRQTASMPTTFSGVMNMPTKTLDEIARKMQAINQMRGGLAIGSHELKNLNVEYARLSQLQSEALGKNKDLIHSNNGLARSFGYIRNRIVYAFTIGAVVNFAKSLVQVRAEYEMLERSIGILIGSMERGTQVFNELNEMALKSPFTLIELGTAAKQLTAYNFAADEVVDTTRRLADISAALGVPMERLTYNLGQIKAQGVLNARDARDFANAGLAIVPMLAQMYTEQKRFGDQAVTTAQVYDMMSKKAVSYSDVLRVLYQVTDEGGKFYDFQAKQADTLKVQLANLTLAYNNMLNEMGKEEQNALITPIKLLKSLYQNWRQVQRILLTVITTYGVYKTVSALTLGGNIGNLKTLITSFRSFIGAMNSASAAMAGLRSVMLSVPITGWVTAIASLLSYFVFFKNDVSEVTAEVEMFGESGAKAVRKVETLQKILKGTDVTSSTYKKTLQELSEIAKEYGLQIDAEKISRDQANESAERTIELIKEEAAERQRANQLTRGEETYNKEVKDATDELNKNLKGAQTSQKNWAGVFLFDNEELQKNADAFTDIIAEIVQSHANELANATGDEIKIVYERIYEDIRQHLLATGAVTEETLDKVWHDDSFFNQNSNILETYISKIVKATQKVNDYNTVIENNYKNAKKGADAQFTLGEKVQFAGQKIRNTTNDALSLYNKIMDIVGLANKTYDLKLNLELLAKQPPKWMSQIDLPELKRLATVFGAAASQGARVKGHTRESTAESAVWYASAARTKQEELERKAREKEDKKRTRGGKREHDELAEAIKTETSLVSQLRSEYEKLTKAGATSNDALSIVQNAFGGTIEELNKVFRKNNLPDINLSSIISGDPNTQLKYFKDLKALIESKGLANLKRIKPLEGIIEKLEVSAKVFNLDKITKGLNSELGKLKDEYELAVELDANPELGDMFANMFSIDTSILPKTITEALNRAQKIVDDKLAGLNILTPFDLLKDDVEKFAKLVGVDLSSNLGQSLINEQKKWRDLFKKLMLDTEKYLDDYVKKYGNYSDKIAELEKDRLGKLKRLNEEYNTDALKNTQAYRSKLKAIEDGASREQGKLDFEEFKNSQYYVSMFENLDYVSTKTLEAIRRRLVDLKGSFGELEPEQLKWIMQQFNKIDAELLSRNPFSGLVSNVKNYIDALKKGKEAERKFFEAQNEYDQQLKVASMWKVILKYKRDNIKLDGDAIKKISERSGVQEDLVSEVIAERDVQNMNVNAIEGEVAAADELLATLLKILNAAAGQKTIYDEARKAMQSQAVQTVKAVATNLQSLADLRDFLTQDLGIEVSEEFDAVVDGLSKTGEGLNKIMSSIENLDVVGALVGVGQVFYGLYDTVASIFGGGSARDKKITRQIEESERAVKRLENTYKSLENTASNAYGALVSGAQAAVRANKELQLAEIQRQLTLEKSRKKKKQDQDKIIELEGQVIDLKNEINGATQDIVNDLLGISSAGAGIESMVEAMIDAFRNGEDAMAAFGDKWDEMIDNMILKLIVTTFMQKAWDKLMNRLQEREDEMLSDKAKAVQDAQAEYDKIKTMSDAELATYLRGSGLSSIFSGKNISKSDIDAYRKAAENALTSATEQLDKASYDYTKWTLDYMNTEGRQQMTQMAELVNNSLGDWYTFGENNTKELSNLQQGIQGITEDTAGALEAYMNSISQQVYLHSDLLTQIRDAVVAIDYDVQTATQAQMLLQMQQSYQVQLAVQNILAGWSNANGMAVRVQMID